MNAFIDILAASNAVLVGVCDELVDPILFGDLEVSCVGFSQEKVLLGPGREERFWVVTEPTSTGLITSPLFLSGERYLLFLRHGRTEEVLATAAKLPADRCFELTEIDSATLLNGERRGGSFDVRIQRELGFAARENVPLFLEAMELLCRYITSSPEERKHLEHLVERRADSLGPWLQRQMALYAARTSMPS